MPLTVPDSMAHRTLMGLIPRDRPVGYATQPAAKGLERIAAAVQHISGAASTAHLADAGGGPTWAACSVPRAPAVATTCRTKRTGSSLGIQARRARVRGRPCFRSEGSLREGRPLSPGSARMVVRATPPMAVEHDAESSVPDVVARGRASSAALASSIIAE